MVVTPLNDEETYKFLEDVCKSENANYSSARAAADISFIKDGKEVEPNGEVEVTFTFNEEVENLTPAVAHIADDGDVDIVEAEFDENEVTFTTEEFSTYGVIDNVGTSKYLTMRGSSELEQMNLIKIDWNSMDNGGNPRTVGNYAGSSFAEGIIHTPSDDDRLYCGNCFNAFQTGDFTAHAFSDYYHDDNFTLYKIALFMFVADKTPEYQALSTNDKYFIYQGIVWAMTSEYNFPEDVGSGTTLSVDYAADYMDTAWTACLKGFHDIVDGGPLAKEYSQWRLFQDGEAITFRGKKYKLNSVDGNIYVNDAYGYDRTKNHSGTCQSAIKVRYNVSEVFTGKIKVHKESATPNVTNGNTNYSLAGAVFGIYKDEACTNKITEVTTNESGISNESDELEAGNYWVKEIVSPTYYAINAKAYPVVVRGSNTSDITVDIVTIPEFGHADWTSPIILKRDATDGQGAEGDGTLEGAEFTLKYWAKNDREGAPTKTWVYRTDAEGKIDLGDPNYKIGGDDFISIEGYNDCVWPSGQYYLEETKAPKGYKLADPNGWNGTCFIEGTEGYEHSTLVFDTQENNIVMIDYETYHIYDDQPEAQNKIIKKDADTGRSEAQGDANLADIAFDLYNRSANRVVYNNQMYMPGDKIGTFRTKKQADGSFMRNIVEST